MSTKVFGKVASADSSLLYCFRIPYFLANLRVTGQPICTKASLDENPLFNQESLPVFQSIRTEHVEPAIHTLAKNLEGDFENLQTNLSDSQLNTINTKDEMWSAVVEPLETVSHQLSYAWSVVSHLHHVQNSPELRKAYEKVQPQCVKTFSQMMQSKTVFEAMKKLQHQYGSSLDDAQKRIVACYIRDFIHGGVDLSGQKRDRFNQIKLQLAELGSKFMNNVLDSTKSFSLILTKHEDIKGLPDSLLQLMAKSASTDNEQTADPLNGPWKVTLDMPCFEPFLKYSQKRELREKVYRAYITRACSGEANNSDIIEKIRELRLEKAHLLNFKDFASLSLNKKMAGNVNNVMELIDRLHHASKPAAIKEFKQLQEFAKLQGNTEELRHWDLAYWIEKQRQHLFNYSDESLRPYFPLPRVLDGLFNLASHLFGISIKAADGQAQIWNPDVRFFNIYNESNDHIASFFLDPFSRPAEKNGGAWMDECIGKSVLRGKKPVAYLVCNQTPPLNGVPSLMTFREVETLFHEFGHGLQHMLTSVPYSDAAGISNVEWDAVEIPSQFMENWMYDEETVKKVSGHHKTGQSLPSDVFNQIIKARQYMAGSTMLRQLYFSVLDLQLHSSCDAWQSVMKRVANDYTILKPLPEDCFPCSFMHIFAGGYGAGYYSYKWAEVMSADAFGSFLDVGLNNKLEQAKVGRRFRDTFLASGGSRHPADVFKSFRGHEPSPDALLKQYGLL